MRAVVIGAGRVGCGLAGEALHASGHDILFVARDRVLAEHLDRVGGYRVRLVAGHDFDERFVDGIDAVWLADHERLYRAIAGADAIVVCVCPQDLPSVATALAPALAARRTPVNLLVMANLQDAGRRLRRLAVAQAGEDGGLRRHGFCGVIAGRAVSRRLGDPAAHEPLTFVGDSVSSFVVDARALRAPLAPIRGMVLTARFHEAQRAKLYTFSMAHATTAYLGHVRGHRDIHDAIRDPVIRPVVEGAIRETQAGLARRYGADAAGGRRLPQRTIARFENPELGDSVLRVGRDPARKLAPCDRLIGPGKLADRAGIDPVNIAVGAAAALCFVHAGDPGSMLLLDTLRNEGIEGVLGGWCRVEPRGRLGRRIVAAWRRLSEPGGRAGRADAPEGRVASVG